MGFSPLNEESIALLEQERRLVQSIVASKYHGVYLLGTSSDTEVLQLIIDDGPHTDSLETELLALGTWFGDLVAQVLGLEWVLFSDEHGTDLGLRFGTSFITVFPRDMMIKRAEAGEKIDVQHLYDDLINEIRKIVASGDFQ